MDKIAHFCQKCRAANESGDTNCHSCGTRLMIITFPKSQRDGDEIAPSYYEDHLLERVSAVEFRLAQLTEQITAGYEIILKQAKTAEKGHILMQSFCESLEVINPELSEVFSAEFSRAYTEKTDKRESRHRRHKTFNEIISHHNGSNVDLLMHLVEEGMRLLSEDEEKQAFKTLERAVLLSPKNVPLLIFVGGNLFRSDMFEQARKPLQAAYQLAPERADVLLLLAIIYADAGESEKSRKMLSVLVNYEESMVFANYIWSMLAAYENNWKEALIALNQVLRKSETPEILYLVGCIYFQLQEYSKSLEYLSSATLHDKKFADGWFMQSAVYSLLDNDKKSEECLRRATKAKSAGETCLTFIGTKKRIPEGIALPFLHLTDEKRHILTGGSLRMKIFVYEHVFDFVS